MSYSSDFHYFPAEYSSMYDGVQYLTKASLEQITNLIQAHWKVEEVSVTLEKFRQSDLDYSAIIPLIVNDNLSCGLTWMYAYGKYPVVVVIDLETNKYKTAMTYDKLTSLSVCMPNAQNVIIETHSSYSGRCYYVLSAMKDMAAEGQPFKTILLCTDHYNISTSFAKRKIAISMSDIEKNVYAIDEPLNRVAVQYGTDELLRMMGTAVCYGSDTVYESDDDMFVAPLDTAVKEVPESIVINDVEYVGINFNANWQNGSRGYCMYNYYFKIEE